MYIFLLIDLVESSKSN